MQTAAHPLACYCCHVSPQKERLLFGAGRSPSNDRNGRNAAASGPAERQARDRSEARLDLVKQHVQQLRPHVEVCGGEPRNRARQVEHSAARGAL